MAWIAARGPVHHQMKLCKNEQSGQLVMGLISPNLPSASQDAAPIPPRKCHLQTSVCQKCELIEDDDVCDEFTNSMEKKRRLTIDQVKYLETSFNVDLKLDPDRKALIAKKLGLRPRQVAIWFQNRRARWKNKQLEQDYEALRAKYDATMREHESMAKKHEAIMEENRRLLAKVAHLTGMIRDGENLGAVKMMGDGPARPLLADSDTNSESRVVKEEQLSVKSELASPGKSEDQSEVQDSGQSYPASKEEAVVAFLDQPTREITSIIAAVKCEPEYGSLSLADEALVNPALLFQQYPNGFYVEDLFFSWEDELHGLAWGG